MQEFSVQNSIHIWNGYLLFLLVLVCFFKEVFNKGKYHRKLSLIKSCGLHFHVSQKKTKSNLTPLKACKLLPSSKGDEKKVIVKKSPLRHGN